MIDGVSGIALYDIVTQMERNMTQPELEKKKRGRKSGRVAGVTKTSAGRTKDGTSRKIYAPKDRPGPYMVPSRKSGGLVIVCESDLEALVAMACELDTRVRWFRSQPCVLDLNTGEMAADEQGLRDVVKERSQELPRKWFVDFEVCMGIERETVFVEVKPSAFLGKFEEVFRERARACARINKTFKVITELDFAGALKENVKLLWRYRSHEPQEQTIRRVMEQALRQGELSAIDLAKTASCELADVYALVAQGYLWCELKAAVICSESLVRAKENAELHLITSAKDEKCI